MKYILTIVFGCLLYSAKGQLKGDGTKPIPMPPHGGMPYPDPLQPISDTSKPCSKCWPKIENTSPPSFRDIVFLMQQNMELSQRLDRDEFTIANLLKQAAQDHRLIMQETLSNTALAKKIDTLDDWNYNEEMHLENRIDSLCRLPYLFIDTKCSRPGVWLTNSKGEYDIFITPINYK